MPAPTIGITICVANINHSIPINIEAKPINFLCLNKTSHSPQAITVNEKTVLQLSNINIVK